MTRREPWYESDEPTTGAVANQIELAWAAGLFEGEGTIAAKRGRGNGHRYQAAIIMTDEDVLRRFASVIGIGKFYGPYQPANPKAQPIWRWMTTKNVEIEALFILIGGWMGTRRRQRFEDAIADIRAHPAQTWFHKLSATAHDQIRQRYSRGDVTQTALAGDYGVTPSMISAITRRRPPAPAGSSSETEPSTTA